MAFRVGVTASTLGAGIQAGVGVGKYSNIRGGFNAFDYSTTLTKDGIDYSGTLKLRSAERSLRPVLSPYGRDSISAPALLIYDDNKRQRDRERPEGANRSR